jgi:hypothetical protein
MTKYGQPVISRETRLLLITILVSITALWVLARIRFQEQQPATAAAVPPMLAQLRPFAGYDDLARLIADIRPGVTAAVFASDKGTPALRIRSNVAVTLAPAAELHLASDRATGLTLVQSPPGDPPGLMPWAPRILDYPRYLVAADLSAGNVSLRPVFVGGMFPTASAAWSGDIWQLPHATAIAPGTFVFTTERAFAGMGVEHGGRPAIVPATRLLERVDALLEEQQRAAGALGITVQPLSTAIASATGATTGVVVTAIDPSGPAAGAIAATDIIEAVGGQSVSLEHWLARVARVSAGETLVLRVRRDGEVRDVPITAAAAQMPEPPQDSSLGLRLRAIPRIGAEVLSVAPRSRAAQAGILPGDVITVAGPQTAPTPAQIARAFGGLPDDGSLLVAITRGNQHRVVVVDK